MTSSALQLDPSKLWWELVEQRRKRNVVTVTLDPRALVETVVGHVQDLSDTVSFVIVDNWHLPFFHPDGSQLILRAERATIDDQDRYQEVLRQLKEAEKVRRRRAMENQLRFVI